MKSKDTIQEEALEAVLPLKRAGVAITMGGGKTLLGLKHMHENYNDFCKFLVVASKVSILEEWVTQAKEHGFDYLTPHMEFSTYLSLTKQSKDYDVVYLDECHSLLYSHDEWLSSYKGKILGLTGTKPRYDKSEKGEMVAKYCPIVYDYTTDEAVSSKILNDYRIIVHTLDLNPLKTLKVESGKASWYTSELASYEYWCRRLDDASSPKEKQIMRIKRMKALMDFPSKRVLAAKLLMGTDNKVLLFANTQEQADSFGVPSYHSKNPNSAQNLQEFKQGKILKLTSVLQISEGANIPNLKEGIIMHSYGNERKGAQRIGRFLRLNPNEIATVHILCYRNTVDEQWVGEALKDFDSSKINWI